MNSSRRATRFLLAAVLAMASAGPAAAQGESKDASKPYEPVPYMLGRDVVWVPTPPALIDKMLDMARLTPKDVVVDLGSGDGRMVIAAAKRGARARGVEFNPDLVALSTKRAAEAGVGDRATFVEGDMFEVDFSDATVMPLFLLPENLDPLVPKFLKMRPGTRIVNNGFEFTAWEYDELGRVERREDCERWCVAYLYIVPAQVAGVWRTDDGGELRLEQHFQKLSGTLTNKAGKAVPIADGRMQGDTIRFNIGKARYTGRVEGDAMSGQIAGEGLGPWAAKR